MEEFEGRVSAAPAGHLFVQARAAYERSKTAASEAEVCVILSAAALEGTINELTHSLTHFRRYLEIENLVEVLDEAEEARLQLVFKLRLAFLALTGKMPSLGDALFQDVAALFAVRNELMHSKPVELAVRTVESEPKPPAYLRHLLNRKITAVPSGQFIYWRLALQSPTVAAWAHNVAASALSELAKVMPQGDARVAMKALLANKEPIDFGA